jgi:hypothetical protein
MPVEAFSFLLFLNVALSIGTTADVDGATAMAEGWETLGEFDHASDRMDDWSHFSGDYRIG